jgi:TetR/AcrR family transcriptional regulator, transcriptional repressor for nem operon
MAGVKQFDMIAAVDAALDHLWRHGCEATSMDDLAQATGVTRGSLYNAFGGKDGVVLAALDRYAEAYSQAAAVALDAPTPQEGLQAMLQSHVARMADARHPRGCFATIVGMESATNSEIVRERVASGLRLLEKRITEALEGWQKSGRIAMDVDLRALARYFVGITRGAAAIHRATGDLAAVRDIVDVAMTVIAADRS